MFRGCCFHGGRQSYVHNLLTPCQLQKNEPWAWNTSSPRGKEPTQPTFEAHLAPSLPCVRKASFYPALDCIVFSLATLIPRCSWQKGLESSPGSVTGVGYSTLLALITSALPAIFVISFAAPFDLLIYMQFLS